MILSRNDLSGFFFLLLQVLGENNTFSYDIKECTTAFYESICTVDFERAENIEFSIVVFDKKGNERRFDFKVKRIDNPPDKGLKLVTNLYA